ncbi:ParB N-terminal domain-containing protein [Frigoriglobus tundricola]|uniref:Uncharacterized protein n=1 Tax=Frigoriglobus tundricola TaxID=2774151 RepID=A0A6M5YT42_9BACT|nr:hypothetical protein [Frigoriglobus tundricola]QJW97247.1 hypothetical protein FTUN_4817 [Frigoriglobus tundricola]
MSESQVADLVDSVTRLGLLQPMVVTPQYNRLIAGQRWVGIDSDGSATGVARLRLRELQKAH